MWTATCAISGRGWPVRARWTRRRSHATKSRSAPPSTVTQAGAAPRIFAIVGEDEADTKSGKISYVSPLAVALLGAKRGDTVVWKRPAGDARLKVERIEYPAG